MGKFLAETPKETPPRSSNAHSALVVTSNDGAMPLSELQPSGSNLEAEYSFMFTQKQSKVRNDREMDFFILDSGATSSATFNPADCVDIVPCSISVNAAGGAFIVKQKGTAKFIITAKSGSNVEVSVKDTLISEKFPFRLWALQSITNKGGSITIKGEHMSFFLSGVDEEFIAAKDPETRLFSIEKRNKK